MKKYEAPKTDFKKKRKSMTIPDQSMTIQEIVKRFVRGVPVDVVQREAVYLDQSEVDMEKLSRMDFGEKHDMAATYADDAARIKSDIEERQRLYMEDQAKAKSERIAAKKASKDQQTKDGAK